MNDFSWQTLLISPIVSFLTGFFGGCCFFFKPQIKLAGFQFCFASCSLILSGKLVIVPLPWRQDAERGLWVSQSLSPPSCRGDVSQVVRALVTLRQNISLKANVWLFHLAYSWRNPLFHSGFSKFGLKSGMIQQELSVTWMSRWRA